MLMEPGCVPDRLICRVDRPPASRGVRPVLAIRDSRSGRVGRRYVLLCENPVMKKIGAIRAIALPLAVVVAMVVVWTLVWRSGDLAAPR